ncbi:MAG: ester cyclase [Chitinophagaceae bacterium]
MYHIAFDAKAEVTHKLFTETNAVLEFNFKGKHIGEFAGLQPTNKEINVPVCVCYDIENGLIKTGRIYLLTAVLMQQLQG